MPISVKDSAHFSGTARESGAAWDKKDNRWFRKVFAKREARTGTVDREAFRVPDQARQLEQRSAYERKRYWTEIIDEPDKDKQLSIDDVKELLNTF